MTFSPIHMKDVDLTIDGNAYEGQVSSVTLTPSSSSATWKGLTPTAVYTYAGASTWVADLTYAQDIDEPTSLTRFLFDHEGDEVTMTFKPRGSTFSGMSANVILVAGALGGAVDAVAEASVSLPVQGRPELI